jgi:FkbM family methyltransferase
MSLVFASLILCTCQSNARLLDGDLHRQGALCTSEEAARHITWMEKVFWPEPAKVMEQLSRLYADTGTWLQIGANTMDPVQNMNDPFIQYLSKFPAWHKVFVEPIPQLYAKLEEAIKAWPNSTAINVALSARMDVAEEIVSMYCLDEVSTAGIPDGLPSWANQICSFDAGHITRHFPNGKPEEVKVNAVSLRHLISKNNISNVRVLMVDTEGFDLHVLQQVPFHTVKPQLVLWEHKHMQMQARASACALMRSHCYGVWELDGENTIALRIQ